MTGDPTEPDWTRVCKPTDLGDLHGRPYMLRASDDPASPWKSVKTRRDGMWTETLPPATPGEPERRVRIDYMTITFYDGTERVLNDNDDVEVG
jgi:hypothetical protein